MFSVRYRTERGGETGAPGWRQFSLRAASSRAQIVGKIDVALSVDSNSGLAIVYYALGRKADSDAALHWLKRAYAEKNFSLQYVKGDWRFSSLQKVARYKALLKKMNLPPE